MASHCFREEDGKYKEKRGKMDLGKQSDCGDCVVTAFQRHCVDCSSTVTADEHNGFQRDNQLENTKHPLSPKQRVSERNATSGEKAGHRKTATSTE